MKLCFYILFGLSLGKGGKHKAIELTNWPKTWGNCAEDGDDQIISASHAPDGRSGSIETVNPHVDHIECQTVIQTNCDIVEFRYVNFDVEYEENCWFDYVQVGNDQTDITEPQCGTADDNNDQYPESEFDWTSVDSSVLTIAFHTDYMVVARGWSMEYRCVEDLINLPPCVPAESTFGNVHYVDYGAQYSPVGSENNLIERVTPEADCAQVSMKIIKNSETYF